MNVYLATQSERFVEALKSVAGFYQFNIVATCYAPACVLQLSELNADVFVGEINWHRHHKNTFAAMLQHVRKLNPHIKVIGMVVIESEFDPDMLETYQLDGCVVQAEGNVKVARKIERLLEPAC